MVDKIRWLREIEVEREFYYCLHSFTCSLNGNLIIRLRAYSWGAGKEWYWESPLLYECNRTEYPIEAQTIREAKRKALATFKCCAKEKFKLLMDVLEKI